MLRWLGSGLVVAYNTDDRERERGVGQKRLHILIVLSQSSLECLDSLHTFTPTDHALRYRSAARRNPDAAPQLTVTSNNHESAVR